MVMRIKVQYICMAFLYVGGFPLYAQKVTDDTISGKTGSVAKRCGYK